MVERLVGAVDAIDGAAEIHGAGAERVAGAAGHEARQIGLAGEHVAGGCQSGHSALLGDRLHAGPGEAFAADADAVADRLAVAEHVVEIGVRRIDDDGAGRLAGRIVDDLAPQPRGQLERVGCLPRPAALAATCGGAALRAAASEEGKQRQRRGGGGSGKGNRCRSSARRSAAAARREFSLREFLNDETLSTPVCSALRASSRRVVGDRSVQVNRFGTFARNRQNGFVALRIVSSPRFRLWCGGRPPRG